MLIVALLILLLIGILATGTYQGNLLQMRMAGNAQQHSAVRQQGLALVDAILARRENFVLRDGIGYRRCAVEALAAACDEFSLAVDAGKVPWHGDWQYAVIRRGPLVQRLPALAEERASSGRHFRGALFEIRIAREGDAQGRGRLALVQGVLVQQPGGAPR